ncbi:MULTISPECIES: hypothetical protein [unclassified Rickettsia]|uniref:hypothetical protein n=1 Tax=unclassified Rickettsia TaxID=114295 RepID=UPI0031329F13
MFNQTNIVYSVLFAAFLATIISLIIQLLGYKKELTEFEKKEMRLMGFYMDKKFLNASLVKNFEFQDSEKYSDSFLESVKLYYKLEELKIISIQELEEDKELNFLFKELLDNTIKEFLSHPIGDVVGLYKELDMGLNTELTHAHRLYVFLPKNKINQKKQKTLIYAKIPYTISKDELESLSVCMHLIKLLSVKK